MNPDCSTISMVKRLPIDEQLAQHIPIVTSEKHFVRKIRAHLDYKIIYFDQSPKWVKHGALWELLILDSAPGDSFDREAPAWNDPRHIIKPVRIIKDTAIPNYFLEEVESVNKIAGPGVFSQDRRH